MSHCLKWENVQIKGFKLFKWNEKLVMNQIPSEQGIFVLRSHPDGRIKRIVRFDLSILVNQRPSPSTGAFQPRFDGLAFTSGLFRSGLFQILRSKDAYIVLELASFARSSFGFSGFTINCPFAPRLVFVLDFSYTPVLYTGCTRTPTSPLCWALHDVSLGFELSEQGEANALREFALHEPEHEIYLGNNVGRELGNVAVDVEATYTNEMKELVMQLRRYRGVGRTFPLRRISLSDQVGLIEVPQPVMWTLKETTPSYDCSICLSGMEANEVVVKTRCGHVFHKDCVLPWLSKHFSCPTCRAFSARYF